MRSVELTERQARHRTGGPRPISNRHVVERTSEVPFSVRQLNSVRHEDPRLGLRTATRDCAALTASRRRWRLRGSTSTGDASPQTVKVEANSEDAGADLGLEPRLVGCGTIYVVAGG